MTVTAKDILAEAKALIATYGWCQGVSQDSHGRFCAVGAIRGALRGRGLNTMLPTEELIELDSEVREALLGAMGAMTIPGYNDAYERTKEEVLSKFDEAIASLP